jgi:hypothetical protein
MRYDQTLANNKPFNQNYVAIQVGWRNAFHQAGRAAAVHLGNRAKHLPEVHFQITLSPDAGETRHPNKTKNNPTHYTAQLEGGRLIQDLPMAIDQLARELPPQDQAPFRMALEADLINLLAGPLAEAKYVAMCNNEEFNASLAYLNELKLYGGSTVLELVEQYAEWLVTDPSRRNQKLAELFLAAYSFINQPANWDAITQVASYICNQTREIIPCEDLILYLESLHVGSSGH